jgi:hypothetical protein
VGFYHYASLRVPERDTQSIVWQVIGPGIPMLPKMQKEIGDTLRHAKTLARDSCNPNSLIALCIVEAVNRDGLALVSKRWSASLAHAERAHELAARLIMREPTAHDRISFWDQPSICCRGYHQECAVLFRFAGCPGPGRRRSVFPDGGKVGLVFSGIRQTSAGEFVC